MKRHLDFRAGEFCGARCTARAPIPMAADRTATWARMGSAQPEACRSSSGLISRQHGDRALVRLCDRRRGR